ncbi:DUF948 domain-containing protein [Acetobacterium paludosum]|uniref:DUF948 domain-containing protein n=2 Tax=Acetobacterium TaxID=33951 RepID=A0A923HRD1_9FIRM|nr:MULTISPECIES: DUF948 domain-containing protein [Acetobacterium]MBC3797194.1 DUF948 domain-containing protein [Acetobacterium tundrae]MBC3887288.1 DUF948 domain-containing protein [Acetobacterium paludosum]
MITLNFSLWELAILLVGIAFIIGTIYLVKLFKSIAMTFDITTKLMEDNRLVLQRIMENTDDITKSSAHVVETASDMVDEVGDALNTIKQDIIDPVVKAASVLKKGLGIFQTKSKKEKI